MLPQNVCPSCSGPMRPFFDMGKVPTNSCILLNSAEEARSYPMGDVVLGFCDDCGFIRNLRFDSALTEYSGRYEETQGFSETFRKFHEDLARGLIDRHNLRGKKMLEIGCGKGEFLALLCELGGNHGVGFDPGYDESRGVLDGLGDVSVISDFYSPRYSDYQGDFVACKMTLEHIDATGRFVSHAKLSVRKSPESIVFFQVPETLRIICDCAFEDIYYEHCSYFTPGSLAKLFRRQGFDVTRLETEYDGQYLTLEARLSQRDDSDAAQTHPAEENLDDLREWVGEFATRCRSKIDAWRNTLADLTRQGEVVVWGSGSKAVSFLHAVNVDRAIGRIVDINPHRQGHYMPGTAQKIVSPTAMKTRPPGAVIVMNRIYEAEIRKELESMGVAATIRSL